MADHISLLFSWKCSFTGRDRYPKRPYCEHGKPALDTRLLKHLRGTVLRKVDNLQGRFVLPRRGPDWCSRIGELSRFSANYDKH
jgi:hypothetical protein